MRRMLIGLAVLLGIAGMILLVTGTAQEVAVVLMVIGLAGTFFTVGGGAGAAAGD